MKQKTKQAARKRFNISARGKVRRRVVHQSHFNAKDTGEETRRKHAAKNVTSSDQGRIKELLPYS